MIAQKEIHGRTVCRFCVCSSDVCMILVIHNHAEAEPQLSRTTVQSQRSIQIERLNSEN